MADDTSRASQDRYDVDSDNEIDLDDEPELEDLPRDVDLSKRAGVKKQLADLFDDVERGFSDQADRADNIQDFWSVYNCELNGNQFYNGNSQIFVPIVKNAVDARKTRYVNQMFPRSGRNVAVTSADGEQPWGMMSLLEHYIQKAQLRTQVMPALMVSGDVEGQYNLYVSWEERERHVTWRGFKVPEVDGVPNPAAREIEDIHEEIITDCVPVTEVLADTDRAGVLQAEAGLGTRDEQPQGHERQQEQPMEHVGEACACPIVDVGLAADDFGNHRQSADRRRDLRASQRPHSRCCHWPAPRPGR